MGITKEDRARGRGIVKARGAEGMNVDMVIES